MQDVIDAGNRLPAGHEAANVHLEEAHPPPPRVAHRAAHVVEVSGVSRCEVVEPDHRLVKVQERFDKVRSNEACGPCDEPRPWAPTQVFLNLLVACRHQDSPQ